MVASFGPCVSRMDAGVEASCWWQSQDSLYPQNRKAAPVGRTPGRGKSVRVTAPVMEQVGSCSGLEVLTQEQVTHAGCGHGGRDLLSG